MASPPREPLIPETYIDVPSQRLFVLSFGLLCQAIKIYDVFRYLFSEEDVATNFMAKWLFVDFAYCITLSLLRIPRLNYTKPMIFLQIALLWVIDGLLFGGVDDGIIGRSRAATYPSYRLSSKAGFPPAPTFLEILTLLSFGWFGPRTYSKRDAHLLGQHTVRMSPTSTAQLNPSSQSFCFSSDTTGVLIPILLNNTNPLSLRYSLTPPGYTEDRANGHEEYFELTARDLKAIEQSRLDESPDNRTAPPSDDADDEYDEYDDDDKGDAGSRVPSLQQTQSLVHIRLTKPGVLRLMRVLEISNTEARIAYPSEVTVVRCPRVQFVDDGPSAKGADVRCAGQKADADLKFEIHGVPPLTLRWAKSVNGKREEFSVEGIEASHDHRPKPIASPVSAKEIEESARKDIPCTLQVPLAVSLEVLGTHVYTLEEIIDGLGNAIRVGPESLAPTVTDMPRIEIDRKVGTPNTQHSRTFVVLRRPIVSFEQCGPGRPTPLLIGAEANLTVSTHDSDLLDAPWDINMKYQPLEGDGGKRYKPWRKTMKTLPEKKELTVRANAPGEYTIVSVKGKYCNGDVLSPETCKVVEQPLPTAQIEWKRIHECSGDTGVSASLILHGTPPFIVYYRTQRDKEPPRDLSKAFAGSRGELTLQPDRSGHYSYTFFQISDANYKKVDLKGPSIDQVVHPLAAAEFVSGQLGTMRNKKVLSSCSGNFVNVEVDLRGTGPWNLGVQVAGPKGSEILQFLGITSSRENLKIPIPKIVDKNGGVFDIDLVSVEDKYGCKRSISVPGISANVRRIEPTAKFYGKSHERHIRVLEGERANLPLRLTGQGPWRVKYRKQDAEHQISEAILNSPNDYLHVTGNGIFEIVNVIDSECPGSVITDASTYQVDWVPKPSARLSPDTEAIYQPHNGSHILPPICEGTDDHVDLELAGKPPFQITYNVAQNSETGGTTLVDQPTVSSIQPRTRFQLHTSAPGRMYYEVKQVGDAAYPLAKHKHLVIPRTERLLFEQEVLRRPSARFKGKERMSYCLHDQFVPGDSLFADTFVELEGTPPFKLQISIKTANHVYHQVAEVADKVWKIDLPSYSFNSIGPHHVTIESVQDASQCPRAPVDLWQRSIWVDVAETAAIVPIDRREHYCVGDVARFELEGTPPWTISYRINDKPYTQEAKVSSFSLLQQQAGEFTITSIAHRQKMCKAAVSDLRFAVHPLPSARVADGQKIVQDIHEGDQAEIIFRLVGEPPFTFTYQRSEPSSKKKGRAGKILETHTVSGVTSNEFSILSALEGTWTITSISDRYCRYPPGQHDLAVEKPLNLQS